MNKHINSNKQISRETQKPFWKKIPYIETAKSIFGLVTLFSIIWAIHTYRESRFNEIKPIFEILQREFSNKDSSITINIINHGGDVCFQGIKVPEKYRDKIDFRTNKRKYSYLLKRKDDSMIITIPQILYNDEFYVYWSDADENIYETTFKLCSVNKSCSINMFPPLTNPAYIRFNNDEDNNENEANRIMKTLYTIERFLFNPPWDRKRFKTYTWQLKDYCGSSSENR